jgi:hypothetical protein
MRVMASCGGDSFTQAKAGRAAMTPRRADRRATCVAGYAYGRGRKWHERGSRRGEATREALFAVSHRTFAIYVSTASVDTTPVTKAIENAVRLSRDELLVGMATVSSVLRNCPDWRRTSNPGGFIGKHRDILRLDVRCSNAVCANNWMLKSIDALATGLQGWELPPLDVTTARELLAMGE